jgi:hypothetical protein
MSAQPRLLELPNLVLGVDPGQSGGLALIADGFCVVSPMPDTEADTAELLREYAPYIVRGYIESVHSMPKQGVASSFKFGRSYGFLRGLLVALQIPFEDVSPQRWKKALGLKYSADDSKTEKKNGSKQLAQQWYPTLKITHATSEALLIAEFGRRQK